MGSEMARNTIESDFQSSKMAASGHFVKTKSKLRIDLKWREMRSKVISGVSSNISRNHSIGSHFVKNLKKKQSCVLI